MRCAAARTSHCWILSTPFPTVLKPTKCFQIERRCRTKTHKNALGLGCTKLKSSSKPVLPHLYLIHAECKNTSWAVQQVHSFSSSPDPGIVCLAVVVIRYNGPKGEGPLQLVLRAEVSVGGTVELMGQSHPVGYWSRPRDASNLDQLAKNWIS